MITFYHFYFNNSFIKIFLIYALSYAIFNVLAVLYTLVTKQTKDTY